MAVLALDLVQPGMNIVPEENRLARPLQFAAVGGGDNGSSNGICRCGLLGAGGRTTERKESSHASGCNATDDECQLTHHHLTRKEEPWPRPRPLRAEV